MSSGLRRRRLRRGRNEEGLCEMEMIDNAGAVAGLSAPSGRRLTSLPPVTVEIDIGSASARGRPAGQAWLIRLRRGDRSVITTIGLSRISADRLAEQITDLLSEPVDELGSIDQA